MAVAGPTLARKAIDNIRHDPARPTRHIDWVLLATTAALSAFGLVMIYSARAAEVSDGVDPYAYVVRQALALGVGGVGMVVVAAVDYRRWRDFAPVLFTGTTVGLLGVLVIGRRVNGAQAWFELGGFQLQPAELAKVTLVLALASYAALFHGRLGLRQFVAALAILGIPSALTLAQPDLGTTLVFASIAMGILLVAGARVKHIVAVTLIGLIAAVGMFNTPLIREYQQQRLTSFWALGSTQQIRPSADDPAYQQRNSTIAIANGGVFGEGFLKGSQINNQFVPERHTDFIFAVVAEQFGLVGAGALLAAYGLLALRLWRIAHLSRDLLGTLICVGALALLAFQVFQNVGMAMGIMPITGLPLPLVSYGGSSTVAFLVLLGLVQNVHMHRFV